MTNDKYLNNILKKRLDIYILKSTNQIESTARTDITKL